MDYAFILVVIVLLIAAWYAWRYYRLRRGVNEYASRIRGEDTETNIRELENLASVIASLLTTFHAKQAAVESERSRLATLLEQITDGVLIADTEGLIYFANPAAGRLFQFRDPVNHSIAEVVRTLTPCDM